MNMPLGYTCAVTISIPVVSLELNKMATLIHSQSLNSPFPMEEEAIQAILQECVNRYVTFTLSSPPKPENRPFDWYVDEWFQAIKPQLYSMPQIMQYLNMCFAIACGAMAAQLAPGIRDLHFNGHDVDEIKTFAMVPNKTQMVILQGISYDELDAEAGEPIDA
jgi:hypothetical protein